MESHVTIKFKPYSTLETAHMAREYKLTNKIKVLLFDGTLE